LEEWACYTRTSMWSRVFRRWSWRIRERAERQRHTSRGDEENCRKNQKRIPPGKRRVKWNGVLTLDFPTQQSPTRHQAPRRELSRGATDESWQQPRGSIPARFHSFSRIRAQSWRHRLLRCNSTNSQCERDQELRSATSSFGRQVRVRK